MPSWSAPSQHTALRTPGAGAALADTGPRRVGAVADGIDSVRREARRILEEAWDDYRGYSFPHAQVYAHLWLWDSCFHAIAWSAFGDLRAVRELEAVFAAQSGRGTHRQSALRDADTALNQLRLYLRLAHRWRWLNDGQYRHVSEMVAEIGRMLGGWLKVK